VVAVDVDNVEVPAVEAVLLLEVREGMEVSLGEKGLDDDRIAVNPSRCRSVSATTAAATEVVVVFNAVEDVAVAV
jgi:hypothetical protein